MTMQSTITRAPLRIRGGALSYLSLFTSLGTLLCCALPSLMVLFGLGATVASVLSEAPWLISMSHHKQWVFIAAGMLITTNFVYVYAIARNFRHDMRPALPASPPPVRRPAVSVGLCFGARWSCIFWDGSLHI